MPSANHRAAAGAPFRKLGDDWVTWFTRQARDPINVLTVDLEDWYQGLQIDSKHWHHFEKRVVASTRKLLEIFDSCSVHATFFVLGRVAADFPDLIREVSQGGHEIATNGWSHRLIYEMTPDEFRTELRRSRALLEKIVAVPIQGHRAPFFSITERSLWALDILVEEGFTYDSSIFPVRNWRYGIPNAPRWPHVRSLACGDILEFPVSTVRLLGRNLPATGGAYFRLYPYHLSRAFIRRLNRTGEPVVFYLHPWEVDPDHPRIPLPRKIALTHYANLRRTQARLHRLLSDVPFTTMKVALNLN